MLDSSSSPRADATSTAAPNKSYRCYFTDNHDRIQSYEQIECEGDAQAALKAQALLAASSRFASAELWQGRRLIGKWGNAGAGSSWRQTNTDSR
jgi:hypothetical protein